MRLIRGAGMLGLCLTVGLGLASTTRAAEGDPLTPMTFHPGRAPYGDTPRQLPQGARPAELTVVSMPDFLNLDVGDVSTLPTWDGVHNSTNESYERSLDVILDQVAAERPDEVLVAGDLVEGHWGLDEDGTGIFGPVDTPAASLAALREAGEFYYAVWADRFTERGLPLPHAAVGDHEIGDNPWPAGSTKSAAVPAFKEVFADALAGGRYGVRHRPVGTPFEDTSYWTALGDDVMLVSVDAFQQRPGGRIRAAVVGDHVRWLREVLALGERRFRWVVVQAHTPIVGRVRSTGSSQLRLDDGAAAPMWRAMRAAGVDLYLCGEVHEVTAVDPARGPVQIAHGGLMAYGGTRYLRLDFRPRRIEIRSYGFDSRDDRTTRMWQTSSRRGPERVEYDAGAVYRGGAILHADGTLTHRSGDLAPAVELGQIR